MPKVPEFNHKPLKSIYVPRDIDELASLKQKNLIITLCERRKLEVPVKLRVSQLKKGDAAQIISAMLNDSYYERQRPEN